MKKLIDEITNLPVSRDIKWRMRFKRDNPEGYKQFIKERTEKHKLKNKQRNKSYYHANREHYIEQNRQYRIKKSVEQFNIERIFSR